MTTVKDLTANNDNIVVECDKNVICAILDLPMYNTNGISEHLGDTHVYQRLPEKEAVDRNNILKYIISMFISKRKDLISPSEYLFLREATDQHKGTLAKFYMSLNTHKTPPTMGRIVCCSGTLLSCLSQWLDYWLQASKPPITSYIKDSSQLLERLREL